MAKLRSKERISWGGWNPFVKNFIETEVQEISRTESEVLFQITDYIIGEREYVGEAEQRLTSEFILLTIPRKRFAVPMDLYNNLYNMVEQEFPSNLTPFEREALRPRIAFLKFFQNDKIFDENGNSFCLWGTQPNQWEIVQG